MWFQDYINLPDGGKMFHDIISKKESQRKLYSKDKETRVLRPIIVNSIQASKSN